MTKPDWSENFGESTVVGNVGGEGGYRFELWDLTITVWRDEDTQLPMVSINTEGLPATENNPDGTPRIAVEVNEGSVYDRQPDAGLFEVFIVVSCTSEHSYRYAAFVDEAAANGDAAAKLAPGMAVAIRSFTTRTVPDGGNLDHICEEYQAVYAGERGEFG